MFGRGRGGGGGRQVCQFFLQGRCKFGDNCKNEHPAGQGAAQSQGGFGNRFSALNNQSGGSGRSGGFGTTGQESNPYSLSGETIQLDLTTERPIWPLSAYGPGKNAPLQLIEGDVEQSPEEMRVKHYLAMASGNPQESIQLEAQIAAKMNDVIQKVLGDINGAVKYVIDGKDQHPNRLDMENKGTGGQQPQQQSAFGAPAAAPATSSAFGQASGLGQQNSAFGRPSTFGQAAAPQSTFGQASAFGKPSQPGFGSASALGGGASAFGQPSNPGQSSGFGQPSAMGGGTSAFGRPSAPGQSSAFGAPSQMGQKPAFGSSTFGQSSQPAFGSATAPGQQNNASPFAAAASQPSGFAQAAQQPSSGFGAPSAFGAAANKPSPFASAGQNQQQQQQSPFAAAASNNAQPQQPQQNPFGSSSQSAFGQPSQPAAQQNPFSSGPPKPAFGQASQPATSAFGQPSQPNAGANPFGQPSQQQQTTASSFGTQQTPAAQQQNGTSTAAPSAGADPSTYLQLSNNRPVSFKNQPVTYLEAPKDFYAYSNAAANGRPEHLWFPSGPGNANPDVQLDAVYYEGALGAELRTIYEAVAGKGEFPGGVMPEVPPVREWVRYDI